MFYMITCIWFCPMFVGITKLHRSKLSCFKCHTIVWHTFRFVFLHMHWILVKIIHPLISTVQAHGSHFKCFSLKQHFVQSINSELHWIYPSKQDWWHLRARLRGTRLTFFFLTSNYIMPNTKARQFWTLKEDSRWPLKVHHRDFHTFNHSKNNFMCYHSKA